MTQTMTYASLFSGAGGFDKALDNAGMQCLWQSELDRQCRAVLRRHWPDVVCIDDVRRVRAYLEPKHAHRFAVRLERPDLLCGGFPCQDISVAGRRAGLAGERSGLWYTFRRIAALLRPDWLLIENVDGLRSSNGGRDLGTILWSLGNMGYGWAYRVFDSQWFGLAQRRERVFIVARLGAVRGRALPDARRLLGLPSEVLFERDSLPWDSPPSREAGERVASCITGGAHPGSHNGQDDFKEGRLIAATLNSGGNSGGFRTEPGEHLVAHTLRAEGFDASEDGTGRGTPIVPFDTTQITSKANYSKPAPAVAFGWNKSQSQTMQVSDTTDALQASPTSNPAVAFQTRIARNGRGQPKEITDALTSSEGGTHADSKPHVADTHGVRRLTPRECERLQGFPDDWTRYADDGSELADSPRYRMMGNAVSVPVVEWIARRIVATHTMNAEAPHGE